jgi:uncharacterized protein (DUF433 family)
MRTHAKTTADPRAELLGQHIVADPRVCHGKVTFKGTRVLVADVLEMVAEGMDWDEICRQWHGWISREAIGEAVRLASDRFLDRNSRLIGRRAAGAASLRGRARAA